MPLRLSGVSVGVVLEAERFVPVWLEAVDFLEKHERRARSIVLEVANPTSVTARDKKVIDKVDAALRGNVKLNLSVQTVAGTLFPQAMYRRHGADGLSKRFMTIMRRERKPGTWGTYAMRLMERRGRDPETTFSPIEQVIRKLKNAAGEGKAYQSVYEVSPHVADDLDGDDLAYACELPTFDSMIDGNGKISNMPCLSHLSFKLTDKSTVDLIAIYRSHWYLQRTLGNLLGLGQLLSFVAKEAGVLVGSLTCISTDAYLDYETWGGVGKGKAVLASLRS
jgi:hypothetical protein